MKKLLSKLSTNQRANINMLLERLKNKVKYIRWLVKNISWFDNSEYDYHNYDVLANSINYFDEKISRFEVKDIYKYDVDSLIKCVKKNMEKETKAQKSIQASKGTEIVFENGLCKVLKITTKEASVKYGKGTKWCISASKDNRWKDYYEGYDSAIYFLLLKDENKKNEKYAFEIEFAGVTKVYDVTDREMDYNEIKVLFGKFGFDSSYLRMKEITNERIIKKFSDSFDIEITKNADDSYDVSSGMRIYEHPYIIENGKLKIKFNKVNGDFCIRGCNLISLEGCPNEVGGDFDCGRNKLTSIKSGPQKVDRYFNCSDNNITSLEGFPSFDCEKHGSRPRIDISNNRNLNRANEIHPSLLNSGYCVKFENTGIGKDCLTRFINNFFDKFTKFMSMEIF